MGAAVNHLGGRGVGVQGAIFWLAAAALDWRGQV